MNVWYAKAVVLLACAAMIAVRAPHGQRSLRIPVAANRKGTLERLLLTIAWVAFFIPLVWIATPLLSVADYPLHPATFVGGTFLLAAGLWLLHRTHADLGVNWSITLEIRERHRLIAHGIYRHVRHPMYLALLVYSAGQALVLPNYIAGPSYAVAMLLLVALRIGPEERMMVEAFGREYEAYRERTKRLIPGVW